MFPGRPVRLGCGDTMVHQRDKLEWVDFGHYRRKQLVASGAYLNGTLADVSCYGWRRADAVLAQDGSLILQNSHSMSLRPYECKSEYRRALFDLTIFGMDTF